MSLDWSGPAAFVAILAAILAATWCAAGIVAWVQAVGARREARESEQRNVRAGGYIPAGTVRGGHGNVRVIRGVKR